MWVINPHACLRNKGQGFVFEACGKAFRTIKHEQVNRWFQIIHFWLSWAKPRVCERKIGINGKEATEESSMTATGKEKSEWPQQLWEM